MKRIIQVAIVIVLVGALLGVHKSYTFVFAQSSAGLSSSIQVQNLGQQDASIQIYYYNQDGTLPTLANGVANPVTDTVKVSQSNTYFPVHAQAGFNGSVVISSGQPIAAISSLVINTTAAGIDSYVGVQNGGTPLYYPLVMKGNASQTSSINIQNTASSGNASITIQFTPQVGSTYPTVQPVTDTIPAGAAHTYNMATMTQFTSIAKWVGSATITAGSGQTIAGVATTTGTKNSSAATLTTYNAFTAGSPTVSIPLVQENNNGNRTSINCQNIGSTTTTVTVTYTPNNKAPESIKNVTQNGLAVFIQDYQGSTKFVGSALVSSNPASNLVCVVNQQKPATGRASSYVGLNPASATSTIIAPLIQSRNGKDSSTGWIYTTVNISTVDGSSHPIKCTFNPAPGFTQPADQTGTGSTIAPSQVDLYGTGAKFIGGATCTSTDGSNIGLFAIINQTRLNTPQSIRDVQASYNAFNQ